MVCSVVEDMALALPELAQGEPVWSPFDDSPEDESDNGDRPAHTLSKRCSTAHCFAPHAFGLDQTQLSIKEGLKTFVPSTSLFKSLISRSGSLQFARKFQTLL